jgi:HlyD family secretion protein
MAENRWQRRKTCWWTTGLTVLTLVLVLVSACGDKIEPGRAEPPPGLPAPEHQGTAERLSWPIWYEAVGTFHSRQETTVAARVTGSVTTIQADAGQKVSAGQPLAILDEQQIRSRVEQARRGVDAARAEAVRVEAAYQRAVRLFEQEAVTAVQYESAQATKAQADAVLAMAEERLREVEVERRYTEIKSPIQGVVTERLVEVGDMAWPGKTLFLLHNPGDLRLEAEVREGLTGTVRPGDVLEVGVPATRSTLAGTVDEVAPSADPQSRTFRIKVTVPSQEGLVPGMYGHLRLQSGVREAIFVPEDAVFNVGQLTMVLVRDGDRWTQRYVTGGESRDGQREILSGLSGGETIGWNSPRSAGE